MYYALNEAIKLSNGKYVGILHSGDLFTSDKVISYYKDFLETDKYDMLFSNLKIIGNKNI